MAFSLVGQSALITGAGGGLGRAAALALAEAGATVVITELPDRLEAATETVSLVTGAGGRAAALPLDVLDLGSIEACVREAAAVTGRLDLLVNNAGIAIRKRALDVTEEDWDRVLDVNLKGAFFVAQAVGRVMRDQSPQGGAIVNMASIMGLGGYVDRAAYCTSKAGMINLTRVLAIEWAELGIRVNAVCPTFVDTPLTRPIFAANRAFAEDIDNRTPMRRLATPEEVAAATLYLLSPAASMTTGHALPVDGGWTAW
jgi:2-deoxy-D-gluconate 3-dehydrogenase